MNEICTLSRPRGEPVCGAGFPDCTRLAPSNAAPNIAEVELNVMIRQCLNRRIDSVDVLRSEVDAWQDRGNRIEAKVNWQFTTDDARVQLKRLYPTLGA